MPGPLLIQLPAEIGSKSSVASAGRDADTPLHIVAGIVEAGTVVMIVDDDEAIRRRVAAILVTEGYEVRPVPSGEAALAEIGLGVTPSVVILDLWLPNPAE